MIELTCPWCGPRNVDEFHWHGEHRPRPDADATPGRWRAYLFVRRNVAGPQEELWFHGVGCRRFVTVRRDTRTDEVLSIAPVVDERTSS